MYGKIQATIYPTLNNSFISNTNSNAPAAAVATTTIQNTKFTTNNTTAPTELNFNYNTCRKVGATSDNFVHFSAENRNNTSFKTNMFYQQQQQHHQQQQQHHHHQHMYHTHNYQQQQQQQQLDLPEQSKLTTSTPSSAASTITTPATNSYHSIEEQKKINNFLISNYGGYTQTNLNSPAAAASTTTTTTPPTATQTTNTVHANSLQNQNYSYYLPYNQQFQPYHTHHFFDTNTSSTYQSSSSYENFSSANDTSTNSELSIAFHKGSSKFQSNEDASIHAVAHYDYYQSSKPSATLDSVHYKSPHHASKTLNELVTKNQASSNVKFMLKNNDDSIKRAFGIEMSAEHAMNHTMSSRNERADIDESKASDDNSSLFRNGATLRERNRMHILNDAFDDLRKIVPKTNLSEHQRLSKIATLRLAIHYISALTKILQSSGGCRPVDPSLLPPTPKRKRRRKIKMDQGEAVTGMVAPVVVVNKKPPKQTKKAVATAAALNTDSSANASVKAGENKKAIKTEVSSNE
jgi:hypothetical protein